MNTSPDFINRYLEKMRALVSELTMKNLILETDISFKIEHIASLETEIKRLVDESNNEIARLNNELLSANNKYLTLEEQIKRSVSRKKTTKQVDLVVKDRDPTKDEDGGTY